MAGKWLSERLDLWKSNGFDITTFKLAFGITDI